MNTQQNQNQSETSKKGVQVNPSRDADYSDKEKKLSGEESGQESGEELNEEINPSELDNSEVDLDRGGVEFSGGDEKNVTPDIGGDVSKTSGKPDADLHH